MYLVRGCPLLDTEAATYLKELSGPGRVVEGPDHELHRFRRFARYPTVLDCD